jgi:hypothetical protein
MSDLGGFDFQSLNRDAQLHARGQAIGIVGAVRIPGQPSAVQGGAPGSLADETWFRLNLPGICNSIWLPRYYMAGGDGVIGANDPVQVFGIRLNSQTAAALPMGRGLDYVNALVGSISQIWVRGIVAGVAAAFVDAVIYLGVNLTVSTSAQAAENGGDGLYVPAYSPGAGAGTAVAAAQGGRGDAGVGQGRHGQIL